MTEFIPPIEAALQKAKRQDIEIQRLLRERQKAIWVKISEVLDQIERKYQERGFVLARVKDINLDPDGTITISIDEGIINKVVISNVTRCAEQKNNRPQLLA